MNEDSPMDMCSCGLVRENPAHCHQKRNNKPGECGSWLQDESSAGDFVDATLSLREKPMTMRCFKE